MRITDFDHLVLTTADPEACRRFYCGALGMEYRERTAAAPSLSAPARSTFTPVPPSFRRRRNVPSPAASTFA